MPGTVAYLVRSWPRLTQTFVLDEVLNLERLGVDVRLFALSRGDEPLVQPEVAAVLAPVCVLPDHRAAAAHVRIVRRAPARYLRAAWCTVRNRRWNDGYHSASPRDCFGFAVQLADLIRQDCTGADPVTHLHAHFAHDPARVAQLTGILTGLPWSFTAHARDLFQVPKEAIAEHVRATEAAVVCCAAGADYLRGLLPESLQHRVRLIHHGVDTDAFQPRPTSEPDGPPRILSIGRLVEKKGFTDLLRACRLLIDRGHALRATIYGDGPLRQELLDCIEELELGPHVELRGARSHDDLRAELQRGDVFALTPYVTPDGDRDGIPNVLLEAMACGLPVVATLAGGVPELVRHEVNGLAAPPRDVDAIATLIGSLLDDAAKRSRLGAAARASVVEHFDGRRAAVELASIFGVPISE